MYCPKCSQQQISDEVRFCSRCGFSLGAVRDLVAGSGSTLVEHGADAGAVQLSCGQKSVRKGASLMLSSLVLAFVVAVLSSINDGFAPLIMLPFLCFVVGFGRVLYGVFVADKRARRVKGAASQPPGISLPTGPIRGETRVAELSASWAVPVGSYAGRRAETAKMVQPPSVAEGTTRQLEEEAGPYSR